MIIIWEVLKIDFADKMLLVSQFEDAWLRKQEKLPTILAWPPKLSGYV